MKCNTNSELHINSKCIFNDMKNIMFFYISISVSFIFYEYWKIYTEKLLVEIVAYFLYLFLSTSTIMKMLLYCIHHHIIFYYPIENPKVYNFHSQAIC